MAAAARFFSGLLAPSRARLLLAASALSAASVGFALTGPGSASWGAAAEAAAAAESVRGEQASIRRRTRALAMPQVVAAAPDPTGFMRALHETAARAGVQVARIAPRPREEAVLDVVLLAPFPAFVRFAAEIELLGATLRPLQARPAEGADRADAAPGQLSITVAVEVPRRAPVAGGHGDATRLAASGQRLRDPFLPAADAGAAGLRDLSATHRLTGITRSGTLLSATIDGMDYEPGDTLDGMQVLRIEEDSVLLARGEERYVVRLPGRPG